MPVPTNNNAIHLGIQSFSTTKQFLALSRGFRVTFIIFYGWSDENEMGKVARILRGGGGGSSEGVFSISCINIEVRPFAFTKKSHC